MRLGILRFFIAATLAFSVGATPLPPPVTAPLVVQRLRIYVYDGLGIHGYTYEALLPTLAALDPARSLATISEEDVAAYRTGPAEMGAAFVLTRAASARVRAAAPPANQPYVEHLYRDGPFLVFLDGKMLYGGLSYSPLGAAYLRHPVMHWSEESGQLVLRVRPGQARSSKDEQARIVVPALEQLFRALGRLERP